MMITPFNSSMHSYLTVTTLQQYKCIRIKYILHLLDIFTSLRIMYTNQKNILSKMLVQVEK